MSQSVSVSFDCTPLRTIARWDAAARCRSPGKPWSAAACRRVSRAVQQLLPEQRLLRIPSDQRCRGRPVGVSIRGDGPDRCPRSTHPMVRPLRRTERDRLRLADCRGPGVVPENGGPGGPNRVRPLHRQQRPGANAATPRTRRGRDGELPRIHRDGRLIARGGNRAVGRATILATELILGIREDDPHAHFRYAMCSAIFVGPSVVEHG